MEVANFFAAPVVLAILLVGIHSYLGLHVLERDVIFVDIGLSQVAALGAAISMFFVPEDQGGGISIFFSLGLCLFAAVILALFRHFERKISQEVLIGMTYALASGLLILVADKLPHSSEHLKHSLIGNILFVSWRQVAETFAVYVVVGVIHWFFRQQFWEASRTHGRSFFWDFLFYLLFGVVITFSTHHAGVLVVFAILVAPAALASRFFTSVGARLFMAWIVGTVGVVGAFIVSYIFDFPAGAGIVASLTGGFFLTLAITTMIQNRIFRP